MKITNVLALLEEYAPLSLSNDFVSAVDGYDNSGIIVETEDDIKGIVFTLDLTDESVNFALDRGANLIVTHHPAIYAPIKNLKTSNPILKCAQNKIGVISMHLNLDVAKFGIDYFLATGLGAKEQDIITNLGNGCGYGRVFSVDLTADEVLKRYKAVFETDKALLFGDSNAKIKKIASFCGSGLDDSELSKVGGIDMYVSSDVKHHIILAVTEMGKTLLNVSHYSSEAYGFKYFYNHVKQQLNDISVDYLENKNML